MYRVILSKPAFKILLILVGAYFIVWALAVSPSGVIGYARTLSLASAALIVLTSLVFGLHGSYSPWRWLWRRLPVLSNWFFPDLNGLWVGKVYSNWPIIDGLRNGPPQENSDLSVSDQAPEFLEIDAVFCIRATLFDVSISAQFGSSQNGEPSNASETDFVLVQRKPSDGRVHLKYSYSQYTPNPEASDESWHPGAGCLHLNVKNGESTLSGSYWTLRRWQEGLNTAGRLIVSKISDRHCNPNEDLQSAANRYRCADDDK